MNPKTMSNENPYSDFNIEEDAELGIEFGEQTRMELTEAEAEFLRVLDSEKR